MSRLPRKAHLRGTLRKLAALSGGGDDAGAAVTAAQEALDFLAMLAGLKPVFLLGRGFNDPAWIDGVRDLARTQKLHVIEGPYWDAAAGTDGLPDWFVAHVRAAFAGRTAWYVCRSRAAAEEVREVCETGTPTVAQEARLLGFPVCCVAEHYARNVDYQRVWLDILRRKAAGDEAEMKRLLADGAALDPESVDERDRLEAAMAVTPCPFTSINMCAACAAGEDTPAKTLSRRYRELAAEIDQGLARALAAGGAMAAPGGLPPGGG